MSARTGTRQIPRLVTITRRHHAAARETTSAARSLDGSSSPVMTPDHARKSRNTG
jgi:hypothetical protein